MATKKMPIKLFVAELGLALSRKDGYIMGSTGQDPMKWGTSSWWFTQYKGSQRTKALYWRAHAKRVWDCNGLAEGMYKDYAGIDINTRARYNYSGWCETKGTGMIPAKYRVPGAAIFWGNKASNIHHVAYLYKPVVASKPEGNWYIIEARGVMYGVVMTKLYSRKPNFWGLMDKYFDYGETASVDNTSAPVVSDCPYSIPTSSFTKGATGTKVKWLQWCLSYLGYDVGRYGIDGDYGTDTAKAVYKFKAGSDSLTAGNYNIALLTRAAILKAIAEKAKA